MANERFYSEGRQVINLMQAGLVLNLKETKVVFGVIQEQITSFQENQEKRTRCRVGFWEIKREFADS